MISNKTRLIIHRTSQTTTEGRSFFDVLKMIQSGEICDEAKKATAWVEEAIQAVKQAAEPNPWKDASDEAICLIILDEIEKRNSLGTVQEIPPQSS